MRFRIASLLPAASRYMPDAIHALDFLTAEAATRQGVAVLYGDEPFFKREAYDRLRRSLASGDDDQFSAVTLDGHRALWRDVMDELATVSLFGGGPRVVLVAEADDFVSQHRAALEEHVAREHPRGLLVLDVSSWPSNTRLAKAVAARGTAIECKAPPAPRLLKWLGAWARQRHAAKLAPAAAELLVELIGREPGLLNQELAKLAAAAPPQGTIDQQAVESLVGGWRTKTTWEMIDAAAAGRADEAIGQLDQLLTGGENPVALLAQIASTLRRFAAATRLIQEAESADHRLTLRKALEEAGFKPFVLAKAESQLRQIGRQRGSQLRRWLLSADLALKGQSALKPRVVIEQLLVKLSSGAARG